MSVFRADTALSTPKRVILCIHTVKLVDVQTRKRDDRTHRDGIGIEGHAEFKSLLIGAGILNRAHSVQPLHTPICDAL